MDPITSPSMMPQMSPPAAPAAAPVLAPLAAPLVPQAEKAKQQKIIAITHSIRCERCIFKVLKFIVFSFLI
jgi:hypothetical protein